MNKKKNGFAVVELLIILAVIAVIAGVGYYLFNKKKDSSTNSSDTTQTTEEQGFIRHLGINLDSFDPATGKAGDLEFTKEVFTSEIQMIFMPYGYVIRNDMGSKGNPQPTFIAPLGTKVYSIVDGKVYDVPKLYSDDYSVQVEVEGTDLIFEMEHVKNVKVKKGDMVKAGDVVAEVSDYDAHNYAGMGLVEFGVLKSGNPPSHLCYFDYLHSSIKDDTLAKITNLQESWEEYRGDSTVYDESKEVIAGCYSREPIEG